MTTPNIVGIVTMQGTTAVVGITSAVQTVVSNAANSSQVYKIDSIIVGNKSGAQTAAVSVYYNTAAAGGGTTVTLARDYSVPQNSSIIILDRASAFYLEEDRSITVSAGATIANPLDITVSYEIISS